MQFNNWIFLTNKIGLDSQTFVNNFQQDLISSNLPILLLALTGTYYPKKWNI